MGRGPRGRGPRIARRGPLASAGRFDGRIFAWVARGRLPWLDRVLPTLSRSANHSLLWLATSGVLTLSGGRSGQRAALRGIVSIAVTSAIANQALKRVVRRPRPSLRNVPAVRRLPAQPLTTSFPSSHAASATAFAIGAGVELPRLAPLLAVAAGGVAYSRVYVGVHYPADVLAGAGLGAAVSLLSCLAWPVRPPAARSTPGSDDRRRLAPGGRGQGLGLVVNRDSGSPLGGIQADDLRARLPAARIIEIDDGGDLREALADAARCETLGICGGDGSATAAAEVALERDRPLLLLPGGTLNHVARDLRIESAEDALSAFERGEAVGIDLAVIDGRPFLNTAIFGGYTAMLDARATLEKRIGRWPALIVAVARALAAAEPLTVDLDGRPCTVWMIFVGNCRHEPAGFAPSWRPRLDDGLLDVRVALADRPLARLRLALSALTGRLTSSRAYQRYETRRLRVQTGRARLPLARDGDRFEGNGSFTVEKLPRRLVVYAPHQPANGGGTSPRR